LRSAPSIRSSAASAGPCRSGDRSRSATNASRRCSPSAQTCSRSESARQSSCHGPCPAGPARDAGAA
jgi:hypothetical protein